MGIVSNNGKDAEGLGSQPFYLAAVFLILYAAFFRGIIGSSDRGLFEVDRSGKVHGDRLAATISNKFNKIDRNIKKIRAHDWHESRILDKFVRMHLTDKDIQIIREYFSGKPVLKAYLFGSYSRNEADDSSDIDILVDLDYSQHIGLGFVQMKLDLEQRLHKSIDLVSSEAVTKRLLPYVNKDKKLIYESPVKDSSFDA